MPARSSQQHEDATFDPSKASEDDIKAHVEEITRRTYKYIGGANIDKDLIMHHLSPSGIETTVPGGNRSLKMVDPSECLQGIDWLRTQYPGFRIEVENMDVRVHKQYVWRKTSGLVEVWANCASTGGPGYLESTKRYVNHLEYRFEAGRWVATKEVVIDGMPGDV